jgi:hypothetical protein
MRQWIMHQSKKPKITAFLCGVPRCIAARVMRILGMCFQTGRNRLAYAIALIQPHLIFSVKINPRYQVNNVTGPIMLFNPHWRGMAGGR